MESGDEELEQQGEEVRRWDSSCCAKTWGHAQIGSAHCSPHSQKKQGIGTWCSVSRALEVKWAPTQENHRKLPHMGPCCSSTLCEDSALWENIICAPHSAHVWSLTNSYMQQSTFRRLSTVPSPQCSACNASKEIETRGLIWELL